MVEDGRWLGTYIPGCLRLDPLRLAITAPGSEELAVAVDMDSPLVGETEGERLFDDSGEPSDFLKQRQQMLGRYYEHGQITTAFVGYLAEKELLRQQELNIDLPGEKATVGGIYLVDEAKLREQPDDVVMDLFKRGYLQAIHSHLMSLHQVKRLVRIKQAAGSKVAAADKGA